MLLGERQIPEPVSLIFCLTEWLCTEHTELRLRRLFPTQRLYPISWSRWSSLIVGLQSSRSSLRTSFHYKWFNAWRHNMHAVECRSVHVHGYVDMAHRQSARPKRQPREAILWEFLWIASSILLCKDKSISVRWRLSYDSRLLLWRMKNTHRFHLCNDDVLLANLSDVLTAAAGGIESEKANRLYVIYCQRMHILTAWEPAHKNAINI